MAFDLELYKHYFVKTLTAELENISLLPTFKSFEVMPPANGFARVEIPLASVGQMEGYVMSRTDNKEDGGRERDSKRGTGRRDWDTYGVQIIEHLLSYSNSEFYYMGLTPGPAGPRSVLSSSVFYSLCFPTAKASVARRCTPWRARRPRPPNFWDYLTGNLLAAFKSQVPGTARYGGPREFEPNRIE